MHLREFWPERRLPFGFVGDWGKLYKPFTDELDSVEGNETVNYQETNFVDIGVDIQFKKLGGITSSIEQPINGYQQTVYNVSVETTDAYFDDALRQYVCCVAAGDIVKVFGRSWLVEKVNEKSKSTPGMKGFFVCDLKSIN